MCSPVFVVGLSKLVEVLAGCRNCLYFLKDTALEKHRKTLKKIVEFFIVNSIGLLSSLPSNRTCWTVFILIF